MALACHSARHPGNWSVTAGRAQAEEEVDLFNMTCSVLLSKYVSTVDRRLEELRLLPVSVEVRVREEADGQDGGPDG